MQLYGVSVSSITVKMVMPSIAAPSFQVMVDPQSITIAKNYGFPVVCVATSSKPLTVDMEITWTSTPTDIISSLSSSSSPQGMKVNSTATINSSTPGTYTITCQGTVNVPGDETVTVKNSSVITILSKCLLLYAVLALTVGTKGVVY